MSDDFTNPGPVLATFDPNWAARFNAVRTRLDAVRARGEPVRDHVLCAQLTQEMLDAHEAQYQHLWQYDAALRECYSLGPRSVDSPLRIPSPPHTASPAQVRAHYAMWREAWEVQRFVASLPPAVEWATGVFAHTPPAGVTRAVQEATVEAPEMPAPAQMTLVVECHPGTTHVCAIQGPECGASVTDSLKLVAGWVSERVLPRPDLLVGLLAELRGPAPRLVFHHTFMPTQYGPRHQLVWGYELRWVRRRLQIDKLETREATPYLRDLSLDLVSSHRSDMALA